MAVKKKAVKKKAVKKKAVKKKATKKKSTKKSIYDETFKSKLISKLNKTGLLPPLNGLQESAIHTAVVESVQEYK